MDLKSLNDLKKVFNSEFSFELNKQRPYILFTPIFEDFNVYATKKTIGGG